MTQVPKELIEASKIDGASPWQSFRHVTIPVIRPFLILSAALSFIWDFQCFGQIWSLRQNSPSPATGSWASTCTCRASPVRTTAGARSSPSR
ncbi:carbohydrate ABC transporter permease [Streptacidiphilus monticola]